MATEKIEQVSGPLLRILCEGNYLINGDEERFTAYRDTLNAILRLGDVEHTGDWDPYLRITLADWTIIETETGYPEMDYHETLEDTIIVYIENPNPDGQAVPKNINIRNIESIEVFD